MNQPSMLVDRRLAQGLTRAQASIIPVAPVMAYLTSGPLAAKSAACGAVLCWLASAYFAWQVFRYGGARASKQVLTAMYQGMIGKFIIVIAGFVVIFRMVTPLSMPALLAGFLSIQAMAWLYPGWVAHRQGRARS